MGPAVRQSPTQILHVLNLAYATQRLTQSKFLHSSTSLNKFLCTHIQNNLKSFQHGHLGRFSLKQQTVSYSYLIPAVNFQMCLLMCYYQQSLYSQTIKIAIRCNGNGIFTGYKLTIEKKIPLLTQFLNTYHLERHYQLAYICKQVQTDFTLLIWNQFIPQMHSVPCCDERRHTQHIKVMLNKERDFRKRPSCYKSTILKRVLHSTNIY